MAYTNVRYAFVVEWFELETSVLRTFYLFFFIEDKTIELFDLKTRRTFLKRSLIKGITEEDLYIGSILHIYSRPMKITEYGDEFTRKELEPKKERTFAMIKPEAVSQMGEIIKIIYEKKFRIRKISMVKLTREHAAKFYEEHQARVFFTELIAYITSGPVVAIELFGDNGIKAWRDLIGPTDSVLAKKEYPETIRAKFGTDQTKNAVHGSDSVASVDRELNFFFPTDDISKRLAPASTVTFKNCLCCVVKPHAITEGKLGGILSEIQNSGYNITAIQMLLLDHCNAEEFYEVYKGVVQQYTAIVAELASSPCVALEISGDDPDLITHFRQLVGPRDPELAKQIRPKTIRAKYGQDLVHNAIHCTDLPEDGLLEVEYFFKILV